MNPESLLPEVTSPEVQAFLTGFPLTLLHAGVSLVLLFVGATLYALLTPYKEISQIRDGNAAASVSFAGVILALAIPLALSLAGSTSVRELAIWGGATVLVQLLVFRIVDLVLMGLPARVQEGEVSAAVLLVGAKLACAALLAAAVAG
jgi:putative membrane protein